MSSELSDALNPYVVHPRTSLSESNVYPLSQQVVASSQQYISDLHFAIAEPPPPPQTIATPTRPEPSQDRTSAARTILRMILASREAQEIDQRRRLAWEQELEMKYARRQAEIENEMKEMREEIRRLKAYISTHQLTLIPPLHAPAVIPPVSHPVVSMTELGHDDIGPQLSLLTPNVSFDLSKTQSLKRHSPHHLRHTTPSPEPDSRPIKRTNHHDTRSFTIQHAMRTHILLSMSVSKDSAVPPSHPEGVPLGMNEPVRFVWGKTVKQSVHNARMKRRVLEDIKARREELYPLVPAKEWKNRTLDAVFDQAFSSLRQRFKAQQEEEKEEAVEERGLTIGGNVDEPKTTKVRRLSRKRTKLHNRSEARNQIKTLEHVTFDAAFQVDCLSSEESDPEQISPAAGSQNARTLIVHSLPWRSARLVAFYAILDAHHLAHTGSQLKNRKVRKRRVIGKPREETRMPPRGVKRWMISKRWWKNVGVGVEDMDSVLEKDDQAGEPEWKSLGLGVDSDSDETLQDPVHGLHEDMMIGGAAAGQGHEHRERHYRAHFGNFSTSSLHNALADNVF